MQQVQQRVELCLPGKLCQRCQLKLRQRPSIIIRLRLPKWRLPQYQILSDLCRISWPSSATIPTSDFRCDVLPIFPWTFYYQPAGFIADRQCSTFYSVKHLPPNRCIHRRRYNHSIGCQSVRSRTSNSSDPTIRKQSLAHCLGKDRHVKLQPMDSWFLVVVCCRMGR